jgi:glucose/arabinose dehydrogenase
MRLHPRLAPIVIALCSFVPHAIGAQVLAPGFTDSIVAQNLDLPSAFDFMPGNRMVVVEQYLGNIRLIINGQLQATPIVTVPEVTTTGERGLLGIAVDPQFPVRPYLYTHQTATGGIIRISRWTLTGDLDGTGNGVVSATVASRYTLLANLPDAASNHNGGTVRFGTDGMLYVSLGDDASNCTAQNIDARQGKILRLRVTTLPPGSGTAFYAQITPPNNPYVARPDSGGRLVYAYGLRNPFRIQLDPVRNCMIIGDVGLDDWEEIDLIGLPGASAPDIAAPGANFGWPLWEANQAYMGCAGATPPYVSPIYAYDRRSLAGAALICGGAYRIQQGAQNFPNGYDGDIFFSEYYSGNVYRLERNGSTWSIAPPEAGQPSAGVWATDFESVSDWRVGNDGALWACRQYWNGFRNVGRIERIAYTNTNGVPPGTTGFQLRLSAYPSPARDFVTLSYAASGPVAPTVRLYDVRGRMVRELPVSAPQDLLGAVRWDGLDAEGRKVANGVYYARLEAGQHDAGCRVVFAR